MLGTPNLRNRSSSRDPETRPKPETQSKATSKDKTKDKTFMDKWVEPAIVEKPSYRDHHGGSTYGVAEHMQPLGEAPNAKVKARVKQDGARKSVLGKSAAAAAGLETQTPEGTPAPLPTPASPIKASTPAKPLIVIEDEHDEDYAPNGDTKKKERAMRPRATKRKSEARATIATEPAPVNPRKIVNKNRKYGPTKLNAVVEAAKARAVDAGKPDLAAAVNEIYLQSLTDARLTELLESILTQTATKTKTAEFQVYVRAAKKKLREAKEANDSPKKKPSNNKQSLPLRSPAKFTSVENENSAIPSTELVDTQKPRLSLKVKSPSKETSRRRSGQSTTMSSSPAKKRAGSAESDSSLTDMTSNADEDMDVDVDGPDNPSEGPSRTALSVNGINGKDQAAERGSLAPPNRGIKRSSAEVEPQDEERERAIASKKQKLNETVTRDYPYEESSIREPAKTPASRLRSQRGRNSSLPPLAVPATTSGGRNASARGSRAVSTDLDSPLTEPLTTSSRMSTPQDYKAPARTFGKKAKTKQSPEKKHLSGVSGMSGASGAGRESPIGDDDNEETEHDLTEDEQLSENNDFCSACGGSGFLLCCDGCDRSFHFSCLDPPLNEDASELNEPWYCYICIAKRPITNGSPEKLQRGLFAPLLSSLRKRNPSNFALPQDIREYFEGVATDRNGSFIEAVNTRTRNRSGYDEIPDFTKVKDNKGNTLLCYSCGKSSQGNRQIIQCDYCSENWHLDCLDPPLSNPPARTPEGKKIHDWMCPLHSDHELRRVDTSLLNPRNIGRKVHIRRPRNARITETALTRGFRNNGVIDVIDDDSDDSGSEFYEPDDQESKVYRLPASGIKLDFIDKVKNTRVQELRSERAFKRAQHALAPKPMEQANFARRSFRERQTALQLAQFASAHDDLDLGSDQVENLVGTLIAEAPAAVVDVMTAAEQDESARAASSVRPPSPPSSEQNQMSAEERKELEMLRELIDRKLEGSKT